MSVEMTSPERFEGLVREQQAMVFRTLTRLTGAGAHVDDLAQEAFLRLYKALPEFRGEATVSTYLYRIVVNLAQDEWKRRRKERTHVAAAPVFEDEDDSGWLENFAGDAEADGGVRGHLRSPEDVMLAEGEERALEEEMARLPEIERAVLVLYHQEECSYEGIALTLALPINTVRTHLHRGRKRLAERVQERMGLKVSAKVGVSASKSLMGMGRAIWKEGRV